MNYFHTLTLLLRMPSRIGLFALVLALSACALQPARAPGDPTVATPAAWSIGPAPVGDARIEPLPERWWAVLDDPALNNLVDAALNGNPTLGQALSKIDEARAMSRVSAGQAGPAVGANASITRAQQQSSSGTLANPTLLVTDMAIGPSLSWEIDLFGRLRHAEEAARWRVDARSQDAEAVRLSLAADVVSGVLSLRACEAMSQRLSDEMASREVTLALTRQRVAAGFAASTAVARAQLALASTRTQLTSQHEQCARQTNALATLAGKDPGTVRSMAAASPMGSAGATPVAIPHPPVAVVALPAELLSRHPAVVAARSEADAAWSEIGQARANRLPRLDLAATLAGQWLSAAGTGVTFATWSIGPSLSGTLFDGGAGAANVDAAEARYRRAVAVVQSTLRTTMQDVENALAAQVSAQVREQSAGDALAVARTLFASAEAQWRAGAIGQIDLEDSRRQLATAQTDAITARRDLAQAWVALVKATGGAVSMASRQSRQDVSHD